MMAYFTHFSSRLIEVFFWTMLALLWGLQLHNLNLYPPDRGFDAASHREYVAYLQKHHRIPLANEGFELYHPPLYYGLIALWADHRLLGLLSWAIIGISTGATIYLMSHSLWQSGIGLIMALSMPVVIYLTPQLSNELWSGALITLCLAFSLFLCRHHQPKWLYGWGIIAGLGLISKATTWVAFCVSGLFLVRCYHRQLIGPVLVAMMIGGWFYARNLYWFHQPLVSSADFPQFALNQAPGYRDWRFWLDPSPLIKLDLFKAHWTSFWAGTYFSFFYDGHNAMVPVQAFSKAGAALIILSLGWWVALFKSPANPFLTTYTLSLLVAYAAYTLKYPVYSTVKGAFLVSLILPLAYFASATMAKFPRLGVIMYLTAWVLLVIKNFWILPGWYG